MIDVETALDMIQELWRQESDSSITNDIAKRYYVKAVFHVETLDFRQNNEYTVVNDTVSFTTTPSDTSQLLYVYKALEFISRSILSDDVNDNALGTSWRSGMETISTATAGRIKQELFDTFKSAYKDALVQAKLHSQTSHRIDIYGTFTNKSD